MPDKVNSDKFDTFACFILEPNIGCRLLSQLMASAVRPLSASPTKLALKTIISLYWNIYLPLHAGYA